MALAPTNALSLRVVKDGNVKTLQFSGDLVVFEVCRELESRLDVDNGDEYGLFLPEEDSTKGRWMEPGRTLNYYDLSSGDMIEYKKKIRPLRVKLMDDSTRMVMVDDSLIVSDLVRTVCDRIGINNFDEFSFTSNVSKEDIGEEKKPEGGIVSKAEARQAKKMQKLKKKLHTDDEVNWLNPDRSLREQGVDETKQVTLRKKFFFSDQNVDRNDPVQLNLLYVQSRDAILNGSHPCSLDDAIRFAALQMQVQHGDHDANKHKGSFVSMDTLLPPEYAKQKGLDKRIFADHRKLVTLNEMNAKLRYIQLCRSLKTYGVTFFLVKEKVKGKNKLEPRLLGVTRDSVLRVDERTKEVMRTWPLTQVRRWAASPNSFTLDFGDYSESYYSVQTTEGEAISKLIAGYIDIILKKKKDSDKIVPIDEASASASSDSISGHKAKRVVRRKGPLAITSTGESTSPAPSPPTSPTGGGGHRASNVGPGGAALGPRQAANLRPGAPPTVSGGGQQRPEQAGMGLTAHLNRGQAAVGVAMTFLASAAVLPPLGTDPASKAWVRKTRMVTESNVSVQLAAVSAAAARLINLTALGDVDSTALGSAVSSMASNIVELGKSAKLLAGLDEEQSATILKAVRELTELSGVMMGAVQSDGQVDRKELGKIAGSLGLNAEGVLALTRGGNRAKKETVEILFDHAKEVAGTMAGVVNAAKSVAAQCANPAKQAEVIQLAKDAAVFTSQLVTVTKLCGASVDVDMCQDQLLAAARAILAACQQLKFVSDECCDDFAARKELADNIQVMSTAVGGYSAAVNETAEKARQAEVKVTSKEETCQKIMEAANAMQSASGNVPRMVTHAKTFAQGSALLCNLIKAESKNTTDKNEADRLLDAAKRLAESTAFLVNCAKAASGKPKDILLMTRLADAGHELRATAEEVSNEAVRAVLMKKLRDAARTATASTSNLTSAVAECQSCNRNLVSQEQLLATSKAIIASINDLIAAERASSDPDLQQSATAQLELIKTARAFIPNGQRLLAACKAAAPTIDDPAVSMTVDELTGKLGKALETLKVAQEQAATACDSMEFNAALELLDELDLDLDAVESTCTIGKLLPLPSDDADQAAAEVGALSKTMQSAIAQLVSAARQGNKTYVGVAARDMVGMLSDFCDACRAVAATDKTKTGADRAEIVRVARDVIGVCRVAMDDCRDVVETQAARHANGDGDDDGNDDEEDEMALAMADDLSKHQIGMQNALDQVLRCLPGLGDVDTCIDTIHDMLAGLEEGQLPFVDGVQQKDLWALLDMSAGELSDAAASIVAASRQGAAELSTAARAYSEKLEQMVGMGAQLAAVSPDVEGPGSQSDCLTGLRNMVEASGRLVESAKVLAADVNTPNGRTMLAMSARALTDSINSMLDNCIGSDTVAGTVECDAAARTIRGLMEQCETVDEPINDSDYFSCLDTTVGRSQALGECMTQIRACVRASEGESVAAVAAEASAAVTSLTEAVLQAAYLVGRADTSAVEAETGVVDQAEFARARQAILLACDALNAPDADQKKILATATVIAKHTSALCNGCKQASKLTTNPVAKQQFVSSAKAVAKSTGQLVATMKRLAIDPSDLHREQCADATQPLIDAVDVLCTYAGSPEFGAGVVFSLSPQALASQMPLLACVKSMVAAAQHFMETCKSGLKDPGDETRLKRLDADSANLAKTLRDVVNNVRQVAPGQEECQRAMDLVSISQHLLDKANLSATLGELEPRDESTLKGFQSHLLQNTQGVAELIMPLASAARGDPLKLGKNVSGLSNYLPNLVNAAIGVASHYTDPDEQVAVLDRVRTVVESAENLIESCRDAGGSTKASEAHTIVDGCAHEIRDACNDLIHTLESAAGNASIMERVVDQLQTLQTRVNEAPTQVNKSVDEYKRVIQDSARNLAKTAARAIAFSTTNPGELVRLGRDLVDDYAIVVEGMQGLEATTSNEEQQMSVHQAVLGLGPTLIALAGSCAGVDEIRNDVSRQKQLSEDARLVNDRVAKVLQAVRAGGRGLVACDTAANIIGQVSRDLETTAMFASAGTLSANDKGSGDHAMLMRSKEDLLRACKALMEGVKNMVSGATSSQEQLSEYAQSTAQTGVTMAKAAKDMATGMATDDRQAQEMILHAVTAVTATLADLFSATKSASGKPLSDPAMESLKDTSKTMVERISNVLKVVKSVDEQGQRAFRALEGAMESIATEIATLATLEPPKRQTSPEDVIQATKALAHATVRCVAAVGKAKTKEIVDGCQDVRRAMVELVQVSKGACTDVDFELQSGLYSTVRNAARDTHSLLGAVFLALEEENPAARSECLSQLNQSSSVVAGTVKTVIEAARELKGDDWVDPNDETAVAENELLSAAGAIEAAARKLAELKPRESARAVDEDLGFEEQIVEAATAIAQATSALVKAANQAQKEMNSSGGTFSKKKLTRANSTWSDGVASASRVVATATHNLVEQANMCVTGEGSQDSLVAAAKQVASTTAQLAVACRVNSDMKSKTQQRLNQAAQIVKKATDALVKAAEEASVFESTESAFKVDERFVGSIAQEMNIQEEILRKERELEGARRKLEQLRKAKYQE